MMLMGRIKGSPKTRRKQQQKIAAEPRIVNLFRPEGGGRGAPERMQDGVGYGKLISWEELVQPASYVGFLLVSDIEVPSHPPKFWIS